MVARPLAFQQLAGLLPGPTENAVIFITSYGVAAFRRELSDFVAATGMSQADLEELADEAERGSDPSAPKVRDQHLVSKTLLEQWCDTTSQGPRMGHYSLDFGARPDTSPVSVAKLENFVNIDSRRVEEVWGTVETDLAVAAAESGTLFDQPKLVETIKDAIVVHYARSFDIKEMYDGLWPDFRGAKKAQWLSRPDLLDQLHEARTGDSSGLKTDAEREAMAASMVAGADALFQSGVSFRWRVVFYFRIARQIVGPASLELLRTPPGCEFIIGDVPVITTDVSGHSRGVKAGVAIGNAATAAMPLSPHLMVALAPYNSDNCLIAPLQVERFNEWQIEAAKRGLFMRSGSPLMTWVESVRPPAKRP